MADLASTRVFGKLTVMHEAIVKANAEIVGNITAAGFSGDGSGLTGLPWASLTGVPSTFTPSAHNHDDRYYTESEIDTMFAGLTTTPDWTDILNKPATATRWPDWTDITAKPSTFAPSAHSHLLSEVTDAGTAAALNVPATGDAAAGEVVKGDDSRLTDTRVPTSHTHPWSEVTGKPAEATRWPAWSEVTSKPSTFAPESHTHPWSEVTGKPATSTRWPSWSEVTSKPSSFTPSSHSHSVSQISDLGKNEGSTSADPNTTTHHVMLTNHANSPNSSYYWHITTTFYSSVSSSGNRGQIAVQYNGGNAVYARSCYQSSWTPWVRCDNGYLSDAATTSVATIRSGTTASNVGLSKLSQSSNGLVISQNGSVTIGNRNTSYTHYSSSTGSHYFYGALTCAGNITAYSDRRVKDNLEVIPDALDKVSQLNGYTYDRTDVEAPRQTGVMAQDVQEVLPEAVVEDPETGHLHVAYGNLVGLLIEAIKEERSKREALEDRLSRLEAMMGV